MSTTVIAPRPPHLRAPKTKDKIDVLDCPFCGMPPAFSDQDGRTHIKCETVECAKPSVNGDTREEAVRKWNLRR